MGIAEAIPGVSGGTIAFITGIYQELIEAINGQFLLTLLIGMFGGLVFGILVISHLLETQKEILWGFFFGLVIASAQWDLKAILFAIGGALLSYVITGVAPADGSDNLFYIFFAGSIAVSALMLPGISGSFILLLFGLYHIVMPWKLIETAYDKAADRIISIDAIALPDVEEYKIVSEINLLPSQYELHGDPKIVLVSLAAVTGLLLISMLGYFDRSA